MENLLLNSGMEQTGNGIPSWTKVASTSDTGMANAVVGQAIPYDAGYNSSAIKPHTGKYALRTYLSRHLGEGSGYSHLKQTVSLTGGKEYTFSAYVNTSALNNGQTFSDSTKGVYLAFCSTSGTTLKKSDVISYNMFAYCENDPVNRVDKTGQCAAIVAGGVVGGKGVNSKEMKSIVKLSKKRINRELRRKNTKYASKQISQHNLKIRSVKRDAFIGFLRFSASSLLSKLLGGHLDKIKKKVKRRLK